MAPKQADVVFDDSMPRDSRQRFCVSLEINRETKSLGIVKVDRRDNKSALLANGKALMLTSLTSTPTSMSVRLGHVQNLGTRMNPRLRAQGMHASVRLSLSMKTYELGIVKSGAFGSFQRLVVSMRDKFSAIMRMQDRNERIGAPP